MRTRLLLSCGAVAASLLAMSGCASGRAASDSPARPDAPPPRAVEQMLAAVDPALSIGYVESLAAFGTRHTLSETESNTRGVGAAWRWIGAEFERMDYEGEQAGGSGLIVMFDEHMLEPDGRRIPRPTKIVNVVAVLPGSMPEARDRHYYLIGHYDSRVSDALDGDSDAPGANDDASGVAVVMEAARIMAQHSFDATIVFMATAAEEQGLFGARAHAEEAKSRGVDIRAVLSNDIVGDPTGPGGREARGLVRIFSEGLPAAREESDAARIRALGGENDSASRNLARYIAEVGAWHETDVTPMLIFRPDRFLRGGDHTAFNEQGFAAVRFSEVYEDYTRQHQDLRTEDGVVYGDLPEHVDPEYLADVTRLNLAALAHLANAPSEPPNARIITASLTNDTTLRWDQSPEPDVAGYEILVRATTRPTWEFVQDVGLAGEATVDLSKDNWLFGVRAYDADGYRSPVSIPTPARR
jgi:hypothetical protein